jgi:Holliday junction resolvasome RuvABC ATP-dependent DNA helicase subunit
MPVVEDLVGLETIKGEIRKMVTVIEGMKREGRTIPMNFNTVLVGYSGTAKTLIGKILCHIFFEYGLIQKEEPVTYKSNDLIGMSKGVFKQRIDDARGGVLFIDDTELLVKPEAKAGDVLNTLLAEIDRKSDNLIVILTGLPFGLREFLQKDENASFIGRFKNIFYIADYSPEHLSKIAEKELVKNGFTVGADVLEKLDKRFRRLVKEEKKVDTDSYPKNGHMAVQEAGKIIDAYYLRHAADKKIIPDDIQGKIEERKSIDEIMKELDEFIGMKDIKESIKDLYRQVKIRKARIEQGMDKDKPISFHSVLTGNPGTGKTSVCRVIGSIFEAIGVLDYGHIVEVDRSRMVGSYVGHTGPLVNRLCDQAMGGILFIDEAYELYQSKDDDFGHEAITTLIKRMEDDRGKYFVFAAGYRNEMDQFVNANPGLKSRVDMYFHFEDYSPDELMEIAKLMIKKEGYTFDESVTPKLLTYMKELCDNKGPNFGNARESRKLFEKYIKSRQSTRVADLMDKDGFDNAELTKITAEDIPDHPEIEKGNSQFEKTVDTVKQGLEQYKKDLQDIQKGLNEVEPGSGEEAK